MKNMNKSILKSVVTTLLAVIFISTLPAFGQVAGNPPTFYLRNTSLAFPNGMWRITVSGTNQFIIQQNTDNAGAFGTTSNVMLASSGVINFTGGFPVVNVGTGFRIGGAAASGNVLRGNGTNFISATLACGDLSNSAASCSTDATNAANISSGTLPLARLSGITTTQLSATAAIVGTQLSSSAAIANGQLANSSITVNGSSISLGGSKTLTLASSDYANQGTTTTVLHGNASGNPSWGAISNSDLTNSSITLNVGTNFGITTPGAMSLGSTYTIGATTDNLRFNGLGLGIAAPTTAGQVSSLLGANNVTALLIKRFTDTSPTGNFNDYQNAAGGSLWTVDITGSLTAGSIPNARLVGSGAVTLNGTSLSLGGTRTLSLASSDFVNQGTTTTVLHGAAAGNPSWAAVVSADLNITTTSCTNQVVTALSSGAVGTCSSVSNAMLSNSGITLNAGSSTGFTAPGAMTLGSTYTFGATTDAIQLGRYGAGAAADGTASYLGSQSIAANTSADGLVLTQSTAATLNNQRFSPRVRLTARGWETTDSASRLVDWAIDNEPVQGTANPSTDLYFNYQINAGGYSNLMRLRSSTAALDLASGAVYAINNTTVLSGSALGSGVTGSSLTSFGSSPTIVTPSITTGFTIGGVAATGTILRGNGTNFVATTATYPTTTTVSQLLYSSSANVIGGLATANNAVLVTSATGVPSIAATSANLQVSSSVLDTIQGIQTTSTPRFARIGLGAAADANILAHIVGTAANSRILFQETGANQTAQIGMTSASTGRFGIFGDAGGELVSLITSGTGLGNIGIGTTSPSGMLSVGTGSIFQVSSTGMISTTGVGPHAIGGATNSNDQLLLTGSFSGPNGFVQTTTLNLGVNANGQGFVIAPTFVEAGSGTHGLIAGIDVSITHSNGGAATTDIASINAETFAAATGTTNATGIRVAAPTGASNNYAINITSGDIYKAGTAYTNPDYAIEMWATGKIEKFAKNAGADQYKAFTLNEVRDFAKANYYLPQLDFFKAHDKASGGFERSDISLILHEDTFRFLWQHDDEINALKARITELERRIN